MDDNTQEILLAVSDSIVGTIIQSQFSQIIHNVDVIKVAYNYLMEEKI